MKALLFPAILLGLFVTGCATVPGIQNLPTERPYSLGHGHGILILSLTERNSGGPQGYELGLVSADGTPLGILDIRDEVRAFAGVQVGGRYLYEVPRGRLVVLELPAGEYRLMRWSALVPGHPQSRRISGMVDKAFRVTTEHPTYVGNLHLDFPGGHLTIQDRADRDLGKFRELYPHLHADKVQVALMN